MSGLRKIDAGPNFANDAIIRPNYLRRKQNLNRQNRRFDVKELNTIFVSKEICDASCKAASMNYSAFGYKGRGSAVIYILLLIVSLMGALGMGLFHPIYLLLLAISFALATSRYFSVFEGQNYAIPKNSRTQGQIAPIYSILIALYDEANVVPDLIANLGKLNWPQNRLDIIFLCEENDLATINALKKSANPNNSRLIILDEGTPRTKPRALNIGLSCALGRFICVYDAEDRPHPMQLREAFKAFCQGGEKLGVVQAPLVTHNHKESIIAGLFSLDYAVWFRVLLPFVSSSTGFIPLGGTSNHFRRATINKLGGWDPYNLTEDADLGVRLGRAGYYSKIIDFPTFEEAPPRLFQWLKQRTRWIHGHIQTVGVHMHNPIETISQLGLRKSWGFLVGIVAGPLFIGLRPFMIFFVFSNYFDLNVAFRLSPLILMTIAEIFLHHEAIKRDGRKYLWLMVLFLPIYWILQSIAFLRAIIHIFTRPFIWEKTAHGKSARTNLQKT